MKINTKSTAFKDTKFNVELSGEELLIIQLWTLYTAGEPIGPRGVASKMLTVVREVTGFGESKQICRALGIKNIESTDHRWTGLDFVVREPIDD